MSSKSITKDINLNTTEDEYLNFFQETDDKNTNNNIDNNINNTIDNNIDIIQEIQEEILNEGIITPPLTRKFSMPKPPVKKSQYITRVNNDGSITLSRKRVRKVLTFESPRKIFNKNNNNSYPSLKIFRENADKIKNNHRSKMSNEEKSNLFSMEPQPVGPSKKWAPNNFR